MLIKRFLSGFLSFFHSLPLSKDQNLSLLSRNTDEPTFSGAVAGGGSTVPEFQTSPIQKPKTFLEFLFYVDKGSGLRFQRNETQRSRSTVEVSAKNKRRKKKPNENHYHFTVRP